MTVIVICLFFCLLDSTGSGSISWSDPSTKFGFFSPDNFILKKWGWSWNRWLAVRNKGTIMKLIFRWRTRVSCFPDWSCAEQKCQSTEYFCCLHLASSYLHGTKQCLLHLASWYLHGTKRCLHNAAVLLRHEQEDSVTFVHARHPNPENLPKPPPSLT